jgi:hypothetical protein
VATLALFARQALIIGYIVLGALLGPWGVGWVGDTDLIADLAEIGIIFLLFLLGLHLTPQKLWLLLKQTMLGTLLTSVAFGLVGGGIALTFGFSPVESALVGVAAMFSSTIVAIKLLPTTVLHHRHTGEVIISVLLLQDLIAIVVLLGLQGLETGEFGWVSFGRLALALPLLIGATFVAERYVLMPLFRRFDTVQEYVFLLTLAWCLGVAQLAHWVGLSHEIGAFVGGIVVATSPIALFIAESLRPLRDFFLVMFFFALCVSFRFQRSGDDEGPGLGDGLAAGPDERILAADHLPRDPERADRRGSRADDSARDRADLHRLFNDRRAHLSDAGRGHRPPAPGLSGGGSAQFYSAGSEPPGAPENSTSTSAILPASSPRLGATSLRRTVPAGVGSTPPGA